MQKDIIEQLIAEVERLKGEDLYLALRGQNARLLAVAGAAKDVRPIAAGVAFNDEDVRLVFALDDALAAVEDLL